MKKEEYVQLHTLLANLKYELELKLMEATDRYSVELREQILAIDLIMQVFIPESY